MRIIIILLLVAGLLTGSIFTPDDERCTPRRVGVQTWQNTHEYRESRHHDGYYCVWCLREVKR
jgi:hypothetical protein